MSQMTSEEVLKSFRTVRTMKKKRGGIHLKKCQERFKQIEVKDRGFIYDINKTEEAKDSNPYEVIKNCLVYLYSQEKHRSCIHQNEEHKVV